MVHNTQPLIKFGSVLTLLEWSLKKEKKKKKKLFLKNKKKKMILKKDKLI
jgi:hypothetical protein